MKNFSLFFSFFFFLFISQNVNALPVHRRYVKPVATGSGNGITWANASGDMQAMINASFPGDSVFVAKGNYVAPVGGLILVEGVGVYGSFQGTELNLTQRIIGNTSADSSILSSSNGADIAIIGNGVTTATIVDGFYITNSSPALSNSNSSPTLSNLIFAGNTTSNNGGAIDNEAGSAPVLTNIIFSGNNSVNDGGAIYCNGASMTLKNVSFNNNAAGYEGGGGMYVDNNSSITMSNVSFTGNYSANYAGGLYIGAFVTGSLDSVTFTDNHAPGAYGGGMYINSRDLTSINHLAFNYNTSDGGGGALYVANSAVFNNTSFIGNTSGWQGGAIICGSSLTLNNATFKGNSSSGSGADGGAIYNYGNITIRDGSFTGNNAISANGGAIMNDNTVTLINTTIAGNNASNGAALYNNSTLNIYNSIIYGNGSDGAGIHDEATTNITYSLVQGGYAGTGNIDADPLFVNAPSYTTAPFITGDYTVSGTSPVINKGTSNADTIGLLIPATDLLGNARILQNRIDIGAYETLSTPRLLYVDSASTSGANNGSSWTDAYLKFEDALTASNYGDTVYVAKGTYYTPVGGAFNMKEGVKIYGSFAGTETGLSQRAFGYMETDSTILSAQGLSGVIENNGNGLTAAAVLDGFIITQGLAASGGGIYNKNVNPTFNNLIIKNSRCTGFAGGGIYNENASPLISNTIIANDSSDTQAGGILNYNSAPILNNVQIYGNIAQTGGGGMFNYNTDNQLGPHLTNVVFKGNVTSGGNGGGMYNSDSEPVLQNVSFISNSAPGGYGGGMYNNSYNFTISPKLTNVKFIGNTVAYQGGGMYNADSDPILTNVLFSGNAAVYQGGGVCGYSAKAVFDNVTFSGNTASDGGAVYNDYNCISTFVNCIIYGNSSSVFTDASATVNFSYSTVEGGFGTNIGTDAGNNSTADPLFVSPVAYASAPSIAGDYTLQKTSPAINAGNNSANTTSIDLAARHRIIANTIDMGAYESPAIKADANGVSYITQSGAGDYTGDSWANASPQVADALHAAATDAAIQQIWVAGGTYKPLYKIGDSTSEGVPTTDRDNAFVLANNVKLYGGFAGTETSLTDRDLSLTGNKSILSGDINNDDALDFTNGAGIATTFENAYHVIVSSGDVGAAALNGFTIKGGIALDLRLLNGGDLNSEIDTIIVNGNPVINFIGGGIYDFGSSPSYSNLNIVKNIAFGGGGMFNFNSSAVTTNSVFSANIGFEGGGGVWNISSHAVFNNITVSNNAAFGPGSGMINQQSPVKINNSILYGNLTDAIESSGDTNDSLPTVAYSIIQGSNGSGGSWNTIVGIDSGNNLDADPQFTAPSIIPFADGDYSIHGSSPAIDAGTPDTTGLKLFAFDIVGMPRVLNARIDIGAYEAQSILPVTLVNFAGKALSNKTAQLSWETATEINTSYFILERSADAKTFTAITTTNAVGEGNNKYSYNDGAPLQAGYYRLRIVDKNGTAKYSNIVYISFSTFANSITVFPNPAIDFVTVVTNNKILAGTIATLHSLNGQLLQQIQLGNSSTVVSVSGLPSGTYLLHVKTGETFKVIVK